MKRSSAGGKGRFGSYFLWHRGFGREEKSLGT